MLDIQFIRDNAELVQEKSKQKQVDVDIDKLLQLDSERRELLSKIETLRAERNSIADSLKSGNPSNEQITRGREVKEQIAKLETVLGPIAISFDELLNKVPNMPTDDTPVGTTEKDNQIVKTVGKLPEFDFKPRSDEEIGMMRGLIDKPRAAKISGSRFAYVKGGLVELQFALINWVISVLTNEHLLTEIIKTNKLKVSAKPFTLVLPPPMIRTDTYAATGRLKAGEVTYKLADDDLWLNGSAEHSLAPMYMDEVIDESQLPIRYLGYSTSFRREAGSYGKDMEGLFRMHSFDKLEMESFTDSKTSLDEHYLLIAIQEYLVNQLGLPYQLILKCTADIGDPNARGVDINVWMPAQGAYRETHSADYMSDYQTRGLKTRVKGANGEVSLAYTNDATAFAMGRTIKAIIENYQKKDGTIRVPEVLKPFLGGKATL